ncbi:hypothetical protein SAY86_019887 [Trapa natans]|uniref:Uncharacterized protein n=1 Tax=Trapa natans TaxID=22666 RepID=A0AAN7R775_TRANT|nr:hypothetical protein SAY86_019887 [Trapa natans]
MSLEFARVPIRVRAKETAPASAAVLSPASYRPPPPNYSTVAPELPGRTFASRSRPQTPRAAARRPELPAAAQAFP